MHYIKPFAVTVFVFLAGYLFGQRVGAPSAERPYVSDSIAVIRSEAAAAAAESMVNRSSVARSDEFYNRLEEHSGNSRLTKAFFDVLVTDEFRDTIAANNSALVDDTEYFGKFAGRKIYSVRIYRNNVFERSSSRYSLNHWANRLHVVTAESRIRNNLLFKEGGTVVPEDIIRSRYLLRSLSYISEADIIMIPSGGPNEGVDVIVVTRDRWTISGDGRSLGSRRYMGRLYDENFLGYGNKFSLGVYVATKGHMYGGNIVEYKMPNVLGTFFEADFYAGEGYYEQKYGGRISRKFIRSNDYMAGALIEQIQGDEAMPVYDTSEIVRRGNVEFWLGKSFYSKKLRSSFFIIGDYRHTRLPRRPEVAPGLNTLYHGYSSALLSVGLYRESYYHGSMIYGFGTSEDIPYGFKAKLIGGRYWGEFGNRYYAGISLAAGRQWDMGYFRMDFNGGTFIDGSAAKQAMLSAGINYFSNLLPVGRGHLRQFVRIDYTTGLRRFSGEGEVLTFFDDYAPRGWRNVRGIHGDSRLLIKTETVVFAPWYWYGFRFAMFGYWDSAFIGHNRNAFGNTYYSTIGIGARIRNERLVFNTIQLRFGIALGPRGLINSNFTISGEENLNAESYKPLPPTIQIFR